MRLFTIGHSTRTTEELVALLREHGVERLVDVRRYPASRRHPHFERRALATSLEVAGIAYRHEPAMGGRRRGTDDSPNTAWRSAGFRAYADHLASAEFREAMARLEAEAREEPTAIMCAEIVPWRCHRQLIADALVARGYEVFHLIEPGKAEPHQLNESARTRKDGTLVYPAPDEAQGELL